VGLTFVTLLLVRNLMYEQSASWMPQDPLLTHYERWTIQQRGISASQAPGCTSYCQNTTGTVGWENSPRHLATPPQNSSRNEPRNSILMTCHYPDQGSAFDWLMQISYVARPIRSATQLWVLTRHQYGISETSFRGETIGDVAKCRLCPLTSASSCSKGG